jgi:type VI secretion system lysozyme-like protein
MRREGEHYRALTPSLLDRLLDDEPNREEEGPLTEQATLRLVKHGLQRDVENLLNSRRSIQSISPSFEELADSLVNYGLSRPHSSEVKRLRSQASLCQLIADTIRRFEPRLQEVRVFPNLPASSPPRGDGIMKFTIEGFLTVTPLRPNVQEISVQAAYDGFTGTYTLEMG